MPAFNRYRPIGLHSDFWTKRKSFGIVPLGNQWVITGRVRHIVISVNCRARGIAWMIVVRALLTDLIVVIPLSLSYQLLIGYIPKSEYDIK